MKKWGRGRRGVYASLFFLGVAVGGCNISNVGVCRILFESRQSLTSDGVLRLFRYDEGGALALIDSVSLTNNSEYLLSGFSGSELIVATYNGQALCFIAEEGDVVVDLDAMKAEGTVLNVELNRFIEESVARQHRNYVAYDSIAHVDLSDDDRRATLLQFVETEGKQNVKRTMALVTANSDNALGRYIFWKGIASNTDGYITSEIYKRELERAGTYVAEFPPVRLITERHDCLENTDNGRQFVDVTVTKSDSTSVSLATLYSERQLTIYHVFDPRNEQTPQSLRILYNIKREPKLEPLVKVVSIAHQSTENIVKRIKDKFCLPWEVYNDDNGLFAKEYGITSLPCFIIVNSDGQILERGLAQNALDHWVRTELAEELEKR